MSVPAPMTFGGTAVPQTDGSGNLRLGATGHYVYTVPQNVGNNGQGLAVTAGFASATWTWDMLDDTDWGWLINTLLAGFASKRYTGTPPGLASGAQLYLNRPVLWDFISCVVIYPTQDDFYGGYHRNVVLKIERIYPAVF